ncbi:MAG: hypothetical protein K8F25_14200 [Fimbriimonadaceae bacterium]|nr:hypothetical protein [Alphaproteobacteria bacterium]
MQAVVLLFVMAVAGLWHGANVVFVAWGMFWGLYIFVARLMAAPLARLGPAFWPLHMGIVLVLWVFFRSPDLTFALNYIGTMFGLRGGMTETHVVLMVLVGCALLMVLHVLEWRLLQPRSLLLLRRVDNPLMWGVMLGLSFWLVMLPRYAVNPFIYFRF